MKHTVPSLNSATHEHGGPHLLHFEGKVKARCQVIEVMPGEGAEVLHNRMQLEVLHASLAKPLFHRTEKVRLLLSLLSSSPCYLQLQSI
jgi:hypothetical protein